jgi:hypothetical protein
VRSVRRAKNMDSVFTGLFRSFERARVAARRFVTSTSDIYTALARRAVVWRERKRVVAQARARFRRRHAPGFACDRCVRTFAFPSEWRRHAAEGCAPKDVRALVEGLPMRRRGIDVAPVFKAKHAKSTKRPRRPVYTTAGMLSPQL